MNSVFRYKATDRKGKVTEGEIPGASRETVANLLRRRGLIPMAVTSKEDEKVSVASRDVSSFFSKVRTRNVMEFTRELAVLLDAGLTIEQALVVEQDLASHPGMKAIVTEVLEDVRAGRPLSDALARQKVFGRLYVSMVRAGEGSGALEAIIQRLAVHLERVTELKSQVVGAMVYPLILMVGGGSAVLGLMIFIVPRFATMFDQKGAMMPASTRALMWTSDVLQHYWWALFLAAGLMAFAQRRYVANAVGRLAWDRGLLRVPMLGTLIAKSSVAHISRTLGMLLEGGVSVLTALQATRQTLNNEAIGQVMDRMQECVRGGEGMAGPMSESDVIPPLAARMIAIGEESAHLEPMLFKVADSFEKETSRTVNQMVYILGPVMIIGMAVIILFVVVSIFSAIYSMNSLAGI